MLQKVCLIASVYLLRNEKKIYIYRFSSTSNNSHMLNGNLCHTHTHNSPSILLIKLFLTIRFQQRFTYFNNLKREKNLWKTKYDEHKCGIKSNNYYVYHLFFSREMIMGMDSFIDNRMICTFIKTSLNERNTTHSSPSVCHERC